MISRVLIVGCGYLGSRVAQRWRMRGAEVFALTRNRVEEFRSLGLAPVLGDVTDPTSLRDLPHVDAVVYAVGMDRSKGHSMRDVYVTGLENVLQSLPLTGRFLYVSSTGVYGMTQGEEVDERTAPDPLDEGGRIVLEAEQTLRRFLPESIILRFAGIYGPKRLLREKALRAGEPLIGDAEKWLNLIHVEDGARAVETALDASHPAMTYNVSDGHPVRRRAFYTRLAELLGAPPATFESPSNGHVSPHDSANRRIQNRKLCQELGLIMDYPSYGEGLPAAIAAG